MAVFSFLAVVRVKDLEHFRLKPTVCSKVGKNIQVQIQDCFEALPGNLNQMIFFHCLVQNSIPWEIFFFSAAVMP